MCICLYHPIKLLPSAIILSCSDSSQLGWFHVEFRPIYVFLGCSLPIFYHGENLEVELVDRHVKRISDIWTSAARQGYMY